MAKYSGSVFGTLSQSIGDAVASTWKGIKTVRQKPASVSNPQTPAQQAQRSRLAGMVVIGKIVRALYLIGFKEAAVRQSEANAFTSANIMTATTPNWPDPATIDFAQLQLSKGSMSPTVFTVDSADASDNEVVITYPDTASDSSQAGTDRFSCLIVNQTQGKTFPVVNVAARSAGTAIVNTFPANFMAAGNTIRVIGFFSNLAGDKSSDSNSATVTVQA